MAAALFTMDSQRRESKIADCCGIAGVVGTINHDSRDYLLEALTVLRNRGYDSAGLASVPAAGGPLVRKQAANFTALHFHTTQVTSWVGYFRLSVLFSQNYLFNLSLLFWIFPLRSGCYQVCQ